MQPRNNKKINAYRGVLKNKNLATILESGFNAPVGSTKRKHAQKVFSILRKMQNDGKGGPGPSVPKVNVQLQPRVVDYSRMTVLPATPKVRVPIGKKAPAEMPYYDGKGGFLGIGGSTAPTAASSMTLNLAGAKPASGLSSLVVPKYTPSLTSRLLSSPLTKAIGSGPALGATMFGIPALQDAYYASQDRILETPAEPGTGTANSTVPYRQVLPPGTTATGLKAAQNTQQPVQWGIPGVTPTNKPAPVSLNKSGVPGQTESAPTTETTPFTGMDLKTLSSMLPVAQEYQNSLSQKFPNLVQGAVDQNLGPTMFAYQAMMQGPDYLKQLPGMDKVPSSMLEGGTLSERLKKTDDALRKSYGLDSLLNNYSDMVKNGATIENRMTDYIRGRDEFLNETEGLISDLKHSSTKMDMSDPRTQANVQNHMNYLYEMRGRQNKRYVEFLKMSVDEYSARTTAAENMYKIRFDEYARELEYNKNITTEQYNTMFQGLSELYTTVADAPLKALQMQEAEASMLATYSKITSDATGIGSSTPADLMKNLKSMNYVDEDGKWIINSNSFYAGQDPVNYLSTMQDAVRRAVMLPDKDGNDPDPKTVKATIANALGHLNVMKTGGYLNDAQYNNAYGVLTSYAFDALNTGSMIPETSAESYAQAISSLKPKTPWYWFNSETPSKTEFISEWGGDGKELNSEILTFLYDQMVADTETSGMSVSDWVDTYTSERNDLAQGSTALTPDALRSRILKDYTRSFKAEEISGDYGVQQIVSGLSQAIKTVESGGNYAAAGASGESGAYQFMPGTWAAWAQEILGNANAPMTQANQDRVATAKITQWLNQGYTPQQVALIWNGGEPVVKSGVNSAGVAYDSGAYADKVMRQLYG